MQAYPWRLLGSPRRSTSRRLWTSLLPARPHRERPRLFKAVYAVQFFRAAVRIRSSPRVAVLPPSSHQQASAWSRSNSGNVIDLIWLQRYRCRGARREPHRCGSLLRAFAQQRVVS